MRRERGESWEDKGEKDKCSVYLFSQGIMLVYSTSDQDSFLDVAQWKEEIEKVLNPICTCTCANERIQSLCIYKHFSCSSHAKYVRK